MAQIILDSNNNLIQGDFDNATLNNRTKLQTTTTNATTNVYVVPNGSSTSAGVSVANNSSLTDASKIVMATNGSTDTQIISGVNGSGTYLPLSFYTNNTLAMQIGTNGQMTVAATANPTFSATASTLQVVATGTPTKIIYASEDFDTNNNYSSSRFTPTIPGYYQFNYNLVASNAASVAECWIAIYKNGSNWQWGLDVNSITTHYWTVNGSALIYCNGSTDYVEVYFQQGTSGNLDVNPAASLPMRFSGFLARSA
jgi:hypothetical protein